MRTAILLSMLLGFSILLVAQQKEKTDSSILILPFNDQSQNFLEFDVPEGYENQRNKVEQPNWTGKMPTTSGMSGNLAPMPNMKINDEVHHTMRIKHYKMEQSQPLKIPLDTNQFNAPKVLPFDPSQK